MMDRTNLAHLKHKLRLLRQENGEKTEEYLKRYSKLEQEIKNEELRLFFIDDTKLLQEEVIQIRKKQKLYDVLYSIGMVFVVLGFFVFMAFLATK